VNDLSDMTQVEAGRKKAVYPGRATVQSNAHIV